MKKKKPAQNLELKKKNRTYEGQKKWNKKPSSVKKRGEDAKARKALGLKKGDKRDASRIKNGAFIAEDRATNRSRGGKIGNKAGKAAGGRKSKRGPAAATQLAKKKRGK